MYSFATLIPCRIHNNFFLRIPGDNDGMDVVVDLVVSSSTFVGSFVKAARLSQSLSLQMTMSLLLVSAATSADEDEDSGELSRSVIVVVVGTTTRRPFRISNKAVEVPEADSFSLSLFLTMVAVRCCLVTTVTTKAFVVVTGGSVVMSSSCCSCSKSGGSNNNNSSNALTIQNQDR